jgi:adenosylmethionine-8-amino-7-oxononanoate aminotransferase
MNWIERDRAVIWHPYTQMKTADTPLAILKGEGALLLAEDGRVIIDAVASWWTNIHGHGHPYMAKKIAEQALQLEHVIFAGFTHPAAIELAERLLPLLPSAISKVFFSDNGSTAVEIAIKMAIQSFYNRGIPRRQIIAFEDAFHGETFGAMSISGDLSLNNPYKPFLFDVKRIPSPLPGREAESLRALRQHLAAGDVAAFIFEPLIMGAGGMLMYEPGILDELMLECKKNEVLCIADEVMTGFGRTGQLFACDHLQQQPDLMALSKGLTGGMLPMGLTVCTEAVYESFLSTDKHKALFHGHSFTGNPMGCAAALASLDLLLTEASKADRMRIAAAHERFRGQIIGHPSLMNVRQQGTILAMDFVNNGKTGYFNDLRDRLYRFFLDKGVLLRPLGNVIYILPPYCITDAQLETVYTAILEALEVFALKKAEEIHG